MKYWVSILRGKGMTKNQKIYFFVAWLVFFVFMYLIR